MAKPDEPADEPADGQARPPEAGASGSVPVDLGASLTGAPAVSDGTPAVHADEGSAPHAGVTSGRVRAAVAGEATSRSRRLTAAVRDTLGAGVGGGVEVLGSGIDRLGEGVSKLGEVTSKVPLVGANIGKLGSKLGEGLSQVGESIHDLPRVASTRRGRLLVRSLVVGLLLVTSWIVAIVALQLKGNDTPDFRPLAARILTQLSAGPQAIERVYAAASPRFQEWAREDRFLDDMNDLRATLGAFKEITAVNDTLVTSNQTGRVGRVSLTVAYENGTAKASISFHADQGRWKLLGVAVEVPQELEITQAAREQRVAGCTALTKACDLYVAALAILEQLRDGRADLVWANATTVFQKQEEQARFAQIHGEYARVLGPFVRILKVTESKLIENYASFDVLTEYARANGVRVIFGFSRATSASPWLLRSLKITLPRPRADELPTEAPPMPPVPVEAEEPEPAAPAPDEG